MYARAVDIDLCIRRQRCFYVIRLCFRSIYDFFSIYGILGYTLDFYRCSAFFQTIKRDFKAAIFLAALYHSRFNCPCFRLRPAFWRVNRDPVRHFRLDLKSVRQGKVFDPDISCLTSINSLADLDRIFDRIANTPFILGYRFFHVKLWTVDKYSCLILYRSLHVVSLRSYRIRDLFTIYRILCHAFDLDRDWSVIIQTVQCSYKAGSLSFRRYRCLVCRTADICPVFRCIHCHRVCRIRYCKSFRQ